MRCSPIALRYPSVLKAFDMARQQSLVTHRHPLAFVSCGLYASWLTFVLGGHAPGYAWSEVCRKWGQAAAYNKHSPLAEVLHVSVERPAEEDIWAKQPRGPGDVVTSLRVALWASMNATSFADGILKAISVGGDTDTYACIAGAVLGAHYGLEGIPQHWRDALQGGEKMIALADALYKFAPR